MLRLFRTPPSLQRSVVPLCRSLGWTEENWGKHTELTKTPFADLTEAQQEAVEVLGYDEETWEDPDEFKSADSDAAEDADDSADDDDDGTDEE